MKPSPLRAREAEMQRQTLVRILREVFVHSLRGVSDSTLTDQMSLWDDFQLNDAVMWAERVVPPGDLLDASMPAWLRGLVKTAKLEERERMMDKVNHPAHYGGKDNTYEAIKVIRAWVLNFALGNTVKYIARAGRKSGESTLDDLKKARWYLDNEIAELEAEAERLKAEAAQR